MSISLLKKRILFTLLAVVLVVMSAACAKNGNTTETPAATAAPDETAAPDATEAPVIDPFAKYDPPVTITAGRKSRPNIKFIEGEDYTNNRWSQELKDRLGINVEYDWIVDEAGYEAKVNLAIASGDIPEAMVVNATQEQQLIDADMILDITELFDQYASPMMKHIVQGNPDTYKTVLTDKKLYSIPFMASLDFQMNVLHLRKDWMDKLGLVPPKTADELYTILDAFVNKDPDGNGKNDTICLSINKELSKNQGVGDAMPLFAMYKAYPEVSLFAMYKAYPEVWIKDASGKLVYGGVQPEMKVALENIQNLFEKGLIDPEFTVKDEGKVAQDIIAEKSGAEFGVFWTPAYPWHDLKKKNLAFDLYNLDIPSADGTPVLSAVLLNPLQKLVISTESKHPEAFIKMIGLAEELWWGSSDLAEYWQGVLKEEKYAAVGGIDTNIPLMFMEPPTLNHDLYQNVTDAVNANDPKASKIIYGQTEAENALKWVNDKDVNHWGIWKLRVGPESSQYIANQRQANKHYFVSEFYGTAGPVQTEKWATLKKMEQEIKTKIIMGQAPVSDFDKFVEQWKAAGGDAVTNEVNAWYDENK